MQQRSAIAYTAEIKYLMQNMSSNGTQFFKFLTPRHGVKMVQCLKSS